MGTKQYFTVDIYNKSDVQNILSFIPSFGYSLHSVQDIKTVKGDSVTDANANELQGVTFKEYLTGVDPRRENNIESGLTDYTKIIFERPVMKISGERKKTEECYFNLLKLEGKIYEKGASVDYSFFKKNKGKGDKALAAGIVITAIGLAFLAISFALKDLGYESLENLTTYLPYVSYGIIALGLLLLVPSLIGKIKRRCLYKKAIKERRKIAKDYRNVRLARKNFENLIKKGKTPYLDAIWWNRYAKKYNIGLVSIPRKRKKKTKTK